MSTKTDIVNFLRTNPFIARLNFGFLSYKVYPTAYQKDVADAISSGEIKLGNGLSPGASATYYSNFDRLELSPSFTIGTSRDQGFLIHECTHAHLDIQRLGSHSGHENEAVGYLAEAVFLEAQGAAPLGSEAIRVVSRRIAKSIMSGTYLVPATDTAALVGEVITNPHYSSKALYISDGFNRSRFNQILRNL